MSPQETSRMFTGSALVPLLTLLAALYPPTGLAATTERTQFFEKRIRPVLVEKCYLCHSAQSPMPMGGLRLDNPAGLLKGGDSGPALVPGDPDKSLLIQAISYKSLKLKMPPAGKLSDEQIDNFTAWVKMGAPDPREAAAPPPTSEEQKGIDFSQARNFWAFRPVQNAVVPPVILKQWPASPIDYFLLARLESNGLSPAPAAGKRTWLRRVTFDLIGLPPSPADIKTFLDDSGWDAKKKVVERLLSSPHYGERWGRHWLDLVRFAETNGHEFDNDKLDAWRYRDYVIRAFNADVPYNQFVKEHIAGDLMADKRLSPDGAFWESPIGTSFYWFGEVLNSATDSIKSRADEVDNQIDVTGKAFQGLTVACARCHDHKFDPIPTADYYALAGVMHSTTISETIIDSPARKQQIASAHQRLIDANADIASLLDPARHFQASQVKDYLLEAKRLLYAKKPDSAKPALEVEGLEPSLLGHWVEALKLARKRPHDPLYPWVTIADCLQEEGSPTVAALVQKLQKDLANVTSQANLISNARKSRGDLVFEDFEGLDYSGWEVTGQAFGTVPQRRIPSNQALRGFQGQGLANSFGGGSGQFVGSLTSSKFKMPKLYLHVRMAGSKEEETGERAQLRVTVVADGHKSQNLVPDGSDSLSWKTVRLTKEIGRLCYLEVVDRSRNGHLTIDEIVLSDSAEPPNDLTPPNLLVTQMLDRSDLISLERLASAYQDLFLRALTAAESLQQASRALQQALVPGGRLENLASLLNAGDRARLSELQTRRDQLQNEIPESAFAIVAKDENPEDVRLHIRGNHQNLAEPVPRRFLQIIGGEDQGPILQGSGRLQVAEWVASAENPLTARVIVNRIWELHFGRGLVNSPDNFGKTGEPPTHPDLLDFLAKQFVDSNWSIKAMHRLIVLSSAYAMSSDVSKTALKADPQNRWLHHMPVKRLEAESIRDSILAVAGTLKGELYGPSVTPHISPYQDGRGKPKSGPLDGDCRRSIYIQVRRNFLTPLFLAFDYPLPISTIGKRSVSTVPSQALMMMNNEFVGLQATEWARRISSVETAGQQRIERMYLEAYGRAPEAWETTDALQFVRTQEQRYRAAAGPDLSNNPSLSAWSDLGHVMMNSAEFIYVR